MINHISLKQLEIFIKIIEYGSLSEASQQLHLTPSAISRNLSQLEKSIGTLLIKRTTRSVSLTEAGEYLYQKAIKLVNDFDESLDATASYYDHPQGELRVTCSVAFGYSHLIKLVGEFRQQYPDIDLTIDLTDNLVNLNESNIDVAIRITANPADNFAIKKLAPINWSYCASPDYLTQYGEPTSLIDLEKHLFLLYPAMAPSFKLIDKNGNVRQLKIRSSLQANSSLALVKALLEHQGIAYLPTYMTGKYVKNGRLKPLVLDNQITYATHSLYALYFPSRYSNPKVRAFVDFLAKKITPTPFWDNWMK